MSAYGHEMDRELSGQSLSSRGVSELGSRNRSEAGIYMPPIAATVFILGLVTVGISLISLLVALTVLLRSCESRNFKVVEMYEDTNSYDYCRNFALHAELNSLNVDLFPAICKNVNIRYIKQGHYRRDLNITLGIAMDFFNSIRPQNDGRDVVLMDADDLLASNHLYATQLMHRINKDALHDVDNYANYLKQIFVMKLYLKLLSGGWPLVLFSRKPEKLHNTTAGYLISAGCCGWSSLIMRKENEMQMDFPEFLSIQRIALRREGFQIIAMISSQMDVLRGPCLGGLIFKLPNPIFRYSMEDHEANVW